MREIAPPVGGAILIGFDFLVELHYDYSANLKERVIIMAMVNVGGKMTSEYVSQRIAINRGRVHAQAERGYTLCEVFIRAGWFTDNHSPMIINCHRCRRTMRAQTAEMDSLMSDASEVMVG